MPRNDAIRLAGVAAFATLVALSGCVAQRKPAAPTGQRYTGHDLRLLELLRGREFDLVAASIPTPPEFTDTRVLTYRSDIRHMLRLFSAEFGGFAQADSVADGTRLYSVSVRAPAAYDCHIAVTTYRVDFAKMGPGYLNLIYCDDRPELKVSTISFGLAQSEADARNRVLSVCSAAVLGMGWAFDRESARVGCATELAE